MPIWLAVTLFLPLITTVYSNQQSVADTVHVSLGLESEDHNHKYIYTGNINPNTDSGKHGMTETSAELFSKTSEMVLNGLNIPMYES